MATAAFLLAYNYCIILIGSFKNEVNSIYPWVVKIVIKIESK